MDMAALAEEICKINVQNGWRGEGAPKSSFPERLMLLAEEVGEAASAWRKWGLEDATHLFPVVMNASSKPEGVGAELADVAIRYVDDCHRHRLPLPEGLSWKGQVRRPPESFLTCCMQLTACLGVVYHEWAREGELQHAVKPLEIFWDNLLRTAVSFGVDLESEVIRKVEYNRTRPYQYGGKRL